MPYTSEELTNGFYQDNNNYLEIGELHTNSKQAVVGRIDSRYKSTKKISLQTPDSDNLIFNFSSDSKVADMDVRYAYDNVSEKMGFVGKDFISIYDSETGNFMLREPREVLKQLINPYNNRFDPGLGNLDGYSEKLTTEQFDYVCKHLKYIVSADKYFFILSELPNGHSVIWKFDPDTAHISKFRPKNFYDGPGAETILAKPYVYNNTIYIFTKNSSNKVRVWHCSLLDTDTADFEYNDKLGEGATDLGTVDIGTFGYVSETINGENVIKAFNILSGEVVAVHYTLGNLNAAQLYSREGNWSVPANSTIKYVKVVGLTNNAHILMLLNNGVIKVIDNGYSNNTLQYATRAHNTYKYTGFIKTLSNNTVNGQKKSVLKLYTEDYTKIMIDDLDFNRFSTDGAQAIDNETFTDEDELIKVYGKNGSGCSLVNYYRYGEKTILYGWYNENGIIKPLIKVSDPLKESYDIIDNPSENAIEINRPFQKGLEPDSGIDVVENIPFGSTKVTRVKLQGQVPSEDGLELNYNISIPDENNEDPDYNGKALWSALNEAGIPYNTHVKTIGRIILDGYDIPIESVLITKPEESKDFGSVLLSFDKMFDVSTLDKKYLKLGNVLYPGILFRNNKGFLNDAIISNVSSNEQTFAYDILKDDDERTRNLCAGTKSSAILNINSNGSKDQLLISAAIESISRNSSTITITATSTYTGKSRVIRTINNENANVKGISKVLVYENRYIIILTQVGHITIYDYLNDVDSTYLGCARSGHNNSVVYGFYNDTIVAAENGIYGNEYDHYIHLVDVNYLKTCFVGDPWNFMRSCGNFSSMDFINGNVTSNILTIKNDFFYIMNGSLRKLNTLTGEEYRIATFDNLSSGTKTSITYDFNDRIYVRQASRNFGYYVSLSDNSVHEINSNIYGPAPIFYFNNCIFNIDRNDARTGITLRYAEISDSNLVFKECTNYSGTISESYFGSDGSEIVCTDVIYKDDTMIITVLTTGGLFKFVVNKDNVINRVYQYTNFNDQIYPGINLANDGSNLYYISQDVSTAGKSDIKKFDYTLGTIPADMFNGYSQCNFILGMCNGLIYYIDETNELKSIDFRKRHDTNSYSIKNRVDSGYIRMTKSDVSKNVDDEITITAVGFLNDGNSVAISYSNGAIESLYLPELTEDNTSGTGFFGANYGDAIESYVRTIIEPVIIITFNSSSSALGGYGQANAIYPFATGDDTIGYYLPYNANAPTGYRTMRLKDLPKPAKQGYVFVGWACLGETTDNISLDNNGWYYRFSIPTEDNIISMEEAAASTKELNQGDIVYAIFKDNIEEYADRCPIRAYAKPGEVLDSGALSIEQIGSDVYFNAVNRSIRWSNDVGAFFEGKDELYTGRITSKDRNVYKLNKTIAKLYINGAGSVKVGKYIFYFNGYNPSANTNWTSAHNGIVVYDTQYDEYAVISKGTDNLHGTILSRIHPFCYHYNGYIYIFGGLVRRDAHTGEATKSVENISGFTRTNLIERYDIKTGECLILNAKYGPEDQYDTDQYGNSKLRMWGSQELRYLFKANDTVLYSSRGMIAGKTTQMIAFDRNNKSVWGLYDGTYTFDLATETATINNGGEYKEVTESNIDDMIIPIDFEEGNISVKVKPGHDNLTIVTVEYKNKYQVSFDILPNSTIDIIKPISVAEGNVQIVGVIENQRDGTRIIKEVLFDNVISTNTEDTTPYTIKEYISKNNNRSRAFDNNRFIKVIDYYDIGENEWILEDSAIAIPSKTKLSFSYPKYIFENRDKAVSIIDSYENDPDFQNNNVLNVISDNGTKYIICGSNIFAISSDGKRTKLQSFGGIFKDDFIFKHNDAFVKFNVPKGDTWFGDRSQGQVFGLNFGLSVEVLNLDSTSKSYRIHISKQDLIDGHNYRVFNHVYKDNINNCLFGTIYDKTTNKQNVACVPLLDKDNIYTNMYAHLTEFDNVVGFYSTSINHIGVITFDAGKFQLIDCEIDSDDHIIHNELNISSVYCDVLSNIIDEDNALNSIQAKICNETIILRTNFGNNNEYADNIIAYVNDSYNCEIFHVNETAETIYDIDDTGYCSIYQKDNNVYLRKYNRCVKEKFENANGLVIMNNNEKPKTNGDIDPERSKIYKNLVHLSQDNTHLVAVDWLDQVYVINRSTKEYKTYKLDVGGNSLAIGASIFKNNVYILYSNGDIVIFDINTLSVTKKNGVVSNVNASSVIHFTCSDDKLFLDANNELYEITVDGAAFIMKDNSTDNVIAMKYIKRNNVIKFATVDQRSTVLTIKTFNLNTKSFEDSIYTNQIGMLALGDGNNNVLNVGLKRFSANVCFDEYGNIVIVGGNQTVIDNNPSHVTVIEGSKHLEYVETEKNDNCRDIVIKSVADNGNLYTVTVCNDSTPVITFGELPNYNYTGEMNFEIGGNDNKRPFIYKNELFAVELGIESINVLKYDTVSKKFIRYSTEGIEDQGTFVSAHAYDDGSLVIVTMETNGGEIYFNFIYYNLESKKFGPKHIRNIYTSANTNIGLILKAIENSLWYGKYFTTILTAGSAGLFIQINILAPEATPLVRVIDNIANQNNESIILFDGLSYTFGNDNVLYINNNNYTDVRDTPNNVDSKLNGKISTSCCGIISGNRLIINGLNGVVELNTVDRTLRDYRRESIKLSSSNTNVVLPLPDNKIAIYPNTRSMAEKPIVYDIAMSPVKDIEYTNNIGIKIYSGITQDIIVLYNISNNDIYDKLVVDREYGAVFGDIVKFSDNKFIIIHANGPRCSTLVVNKDNTLSLRKYDGTALGKAINTGTNLHTIQEVDLTMLFDSELDEYDSRHNNE